MTLIGKGFDFHVHQEGDGRVIKIPTRWAKGVDHYALGIIVLQHVFGDDMIGNAQVKEHDNPRGFCIEQKMFDGDTFVPLTPELAREYERQWRAFREEELWMQQTHSTAVDFFGLRVLVWTTVADNVRINPSSGDLVIQDTWTTETNPLHSVKSYLLNFLPTQKILARNYPKV